MFREIFFRINALLSRMKAKPSRRKPPNFLEKRQNFREYTHNNNIDIYFETGSIEKNNYRMQRFFILISNVMSYKAINKLMREKV